MRRFLIPLGLFVVLVGFLAWGLKPGYDPHEVPSPLVNKAAPNFDLTQLADPGAHFSPQEMRGRVWLLNVWASWCVSCREEAPVLMRFAKTGAAPLYGLNYKDKRNEAQAWLAQFGNPYLLNAFDGDGRVGIDYGVYGVPETYVIDKLGVIRYKQIGPVTDAVLKDKILPLLKELNR